MSHGEKYSWKSIIFKYHILTLVKLYFNVQTYKWLSKFIIYFSSEHEKDFEICFRLGQLKWWRNAKEKKEREILYGKAIHRTENNLLHYSKITFLLN